MYRSKRICVLAFLIMVSGLVFAQNKKPRVSPQETADGVVQGAKIVIHYSSPSVKERKIWGGLVPYDSVWRACANEATTFETDKDIKVEGKLLPAGKYAFFLIPKENGDWTAIFNTVSSQWGAFKYDSSKDRLRVNVKATPTRARQEMLVYHITAKGFSLDWENISVMVAIR